MLQADHKPAYYLPDCDRTPAEGLIGEENMKFLAECKLDMPTWTTWRDQASEVRGMAGIVLMAELLAKLLDGSALKVHMNVVNARYESRER